MLFLGYDLGSSSLKTCLLDGDSGDGGSRASEALPGGLRGRVAWLDMPPADVSSSEVRDRLAAGRSVEGLVPDAVREYIAEHGLYRDQSGD